MGSSNSKILPLDDSSPDTPLYVGSIEFLVSDTYVEKHKIRTIVSCVPETSPEIQDFTDKHELHHFLFPLDDAMEGETTLFSAAPGMHAVAEYIHKERLEGRAVLIHCDAGVSRSPAVCIGYLMLYGKSLNNPQRMPLDEARSLVNQQRPSVELRQYTRDLEALENGVVLMYREGQGFRDLDDDDFEICAPPPPAKFRSQHSQAA